MAHPDVDRPLSVQLYPASHPPTGGVMVKALAGAAATIDLGKRTVVQIALPDRAVTEQRYVVDQVLRHVATLVGFSEAELTVAGGVPDHAALTIGLDLHNRVGAVNVLGRESLTSEIARLGALEDGYRAWVDEDPSTRTSLAIVRDITSWGSQHADVHTESFTEETLAELGLRLLLAVGQGSEASPSRLVIARYTPGGRSENPLMLLGKGVTFDSGGINVKPYEAFVPMMKNDMAGAALAFHLFKGLVESNYPDPLLLVVPTCENAVDAKSMRPGSIVKSYRGHTVRIDHTDAEGRLILADALAYASDHYEPAKIFCFATLTTAALIAYGPYATPVHFADRELEVTLSKTGAEIGEDLHFFPERIWHLEANRDQEADLRNTARLPGNASRGAGSRNAGHFLKHFTDRPLVHFDIFASTWNWAGDAPGAGYGATGAPLRTLLRALQ